MSGDDTKSGRTFLSASSIMALLLPEQTSFLSVMSIWGMMERPPSWQMCNTCSLTSLKCSNLLLDRTHNLVGREDKEPGLMLGEKWLV